MLGKSEENILKLIKLGPLFIIIILIIVMYVEFTTNNEFLKQHITQIKEETTTEKKSQIKREVESVYEYIKVELSQTKLNIKQDIKSRVYEAYTIANSIYKNNKYKTAKEVEKLIFDALRDIRFNNGRGYFFISKLDGTNVMHPVLPKLEGKNLWNLKDKKGNYITRGFTQLSNKYGEGYQTWWFSKPKDKDRSYEKIGFIKLFEPFDWFIGTGEYVVDYENSLKKELLRKINKIRFGKDGYVFVINEFGTYLSHVKKENIGLNRINLEDKNGFMITKEAIKTAQQGEGYISYFGIIQPTTGKPAEKISFIKGFEKWKWAIGAGVYMNELNSQISERNEIIIKNNDSQFEKIFFINLLIFGVLLIASLYLARITKNKFLEYKQTTKEKTDELEELNNSLEYKVKERTEEQNSLLSLFEKGDSVLFRWNNDEKWSVDYVSSNVNKIIGYTKEGFFNNVISYSDCIHKDDLEQTIKEDRYRKQEGKEFFRHTPYRVVTKNGTVKWILEYNLLVRNKKGEITHYLGCLLDETSNKLASEKLIKQAKELKESQAKAELANKAKSEFLSNMSHEIRTPMNAIIGFAELTAKMDLPNKALTNINIIQKSSKALVTIINDILDLSKIEAGKLQITKESTNIENLAEELNAIFSVKAEQQGLFFDITFTEHFSGILIVDEIRIRQILINLIGNALKFTEKGHVIVYFESKPNKDNDDTIDLKITIEDTGIGIEEKDIEKVFGMFEQQSSQDNRLYGGTGLGLSISNKLASLMNGNITLTSEKGKGSKFSLEIEHVEIATTAPSISKSRSDIEFENSLILVVDDIQTNIDLLDNILTSYGFSLITAKNGQEAVELSQEKKPSLILMDLKMPVLDGFDASRIIKENSKTSHIPIIAISASVLGSKDISIQNNFFDEFLPKPVNVLDLENALAKYLKHKKTKIITKDKENSVTNLNFNIIKDKNNTLSLANDAYNNGDLQSAEELVELLEKENFDQTFINNLKDDIENLDIETVENQMKLIIDELE